MPEIRRHAAIVFTDIVGYTRLMGSDEQKAVDMLSRNRTIHQSCIEKFNGTLIKEIGDGILASFSLASEAVRCAVEIQKDCKEQGIPLKIGIHEGEMIFSGSDVIGDGVNIASRLQEDAQEGCINISASVYGNIRNKSDIQTTLIGERSYKNVGEPIRVYKVLCGVEEHEEQSNEKETIKKPIGKITYYILAGLVVIIVAIFLIWKFVQFEEKVELDKSIAVLPFDYLGEDQTKKYQADGVMTAIFNHLSKIKELRVIGKTSTEKYEDNPVDPREMGKDLNVSYLLSGNLQMFGNNARLNVGLINTYDGSTMWSNEYDRDWSDIFKVQSEVSQTIAKEIAVNITRETKEVIETIPTTDLTAYDYYLRGKEYEGLSNNEEDFRDAFQMYEKAVEIDSTFVLAWAGLASSSRRIYWLYYDRSEEQLLKTKKYLDKALALSPNLKEVQLVAGSYYYHCKLDYPKALQILEPLKSEYPNDEELNFMIGLVYRRMGEFKKSLQYNNIAISLNPSFWRYWYDAGFTFRVLRKYNDAEIYYKRAIELNPSDQDSYNVLLILYANTGQIKKAREFIQNNQRHINQPKIKLTQAYIEVLGRNIEKAIEITESLSEEPIFDTDYYRTKNLQLGLIYNTISKKEKAFEHFEIERVLLEEKANELKNDSRLLRSLGICYAGLNNKLKAIEAGRKATEMLGFNKDAMDGFFAEMDLIKILIMVKEYDEGISRLENLLNQTGFISIEQIKLDPFWNPVRDMNKFKEIISNPEYQINLSEN